jgi:hypothetical protein
VRKKLMAPNLAALVLCIGAIVSLSAASSANALARPAKPACRVPALAGKSLVVAKTGIRKAHCRLGKVTYVQSTVRKKNRVVSQHPTRGRKLTKGARVHLVMGRGPSTSRPPAPAPATAPAPAQAPAPPNSDSGSGGGTGEGSGTTGGGSPTGSGSPEGATTGTASVELGKSVVGPGQVVGVTGRGFAPGATVSLVLHSTPVDLGTVIAGSDGTFSHDVTVPESTEGGNHQIIASGNDSAGNAAAASAPLGVDAGPPTLVDFSFTPTSVDTTSGPQTITVTAHITDDLAGNAGPGYFSSPSQVRFVSPSGNQSVWAMMSGYERISGTPTDGVYEYKLTLPQFSEQGTWHVASLMLVDQVGNTRRLTQSQLEADGFHATFTNG